MNFTRLFNSLYSIVKRAAQILLSETNYNFKLPILSDQRGILNEQNIENDKITEINQDNCKEEESQVDNIIEKEQIDTEKIEKKDKNAAETVENKTGSKNSSVSVSFLINHFETRQESNRTEKSIHKPKFGNSVANMIKIFETTHENPKIRNKEIQTPQRLANNSTATLNTENKVSLLINKFENKKEEKNNCIS